MRRFRQKCRLASIPNARYLARSLNRYNVTSLQSGPSLKPATIKQFDHEHEHEHEHEESTICLRCSMFDVSTLVTFASLVFFCPSHPRYPCHPRLDSGLPRRRAVQSAI